MKPHEYMSPDHYIKQEANVCPICRYDGGLDDGDLNIISSTEIHLGAYCPACKHEWVDVYKLVDYVGVEKEMPYG